MVLTLASELKEDPGKELGFKRLERDRFFSCHMAMTFERTFPYLKGFHLTLCSHLKFRDEEGWKTRELEWKEYVKKWVQESNWSREEGDEILGDLVYDPKNTPFTVKPVPRFNSCLRALWQLFEHEEPPVVLVRSMAVFLLLYGFDDASGTGFGSTCLLDKGIWYRCGT